MAKTDEIDSVLQAIDELEVQYKSPLTNTLFENLAKNLNYMCSVLENIKCVELPFGSSTWTTPANVCTVIAVGISGAGGGGGTAPFSTGGGVNNSTLYGGFGGVSGQDTLFNGQVVAEGGLGGTAYLFRANLDGGGAAGDGFSPLNIESQCSINRDSIKGLSVPLGGEGAYWNGKFIVEPGYSYSQGSASGGSSGKIGIRVFDNLNPSTAYPVVIGTGGGGGINSFVSPAWAANTGNTLFNSTAGNNSPGMILICLGF